MSCPSIIFNDGNSAPWLAFGTGTVLKGKDVAQSVTMAINSGIIHLDGAQLYYNEDSLGEGIKASGKLRSELYITTKLKELKEGQSVKDALVLSLAKLQVDYVDLFLIHSPLPHIGKLKRVWKEMEGIKMAGLAKSIGVSNFTVDYLNEVLDGASIIPAVNQIEFHPYILGATEPIVKLCQERKITIASYGGLTPVVRAPGGPLDPVLNTISARLEKTQGKRVTIGQVLVKWMQQEGIMVVTTTSKAERVREYLDVLALPDLTPQEVGAIKEVGRTVHKRIYMRHVFNE